jgi:hypothetical protein
VLSTDTDVAAGAFGALMGSSLSIGPDPQANL